MRRFFDDYGDSFVRDGAGGYVFSAGMSEDSLTRYLRNAVKSEVLSLTRRFDRLSPEYTFIIGGCDPADNILFEYRSRCFPGRLTSAVLSGRCGKYVIREKDVKIDSVMFNSSADAVFREMFSDRGRWIDFLGGGRLGVFAVTHSRLDCYAVFKALKYLYGGSNCVNVWKDEMQREKPCVTAVNDLIDKYSAHMSKMNRSPAFRDAVEELRRYCDECMASVAEK